MKIYKISLKTNYADEFKVSAYMYCNEIGMAEWQNHILRCLNRRYEEDGEIRFSIGTNEVLYLEPDDFVVEETDMTEEEYATLKKYGCTEQDNFGIFDTAYEICWDYEDEDFDDETTDKD